MKILIIAGGGAIGALMRYYSSLFISNRSDGTFPLGTLFVNIAGSFIIGSLWGIAEDKYLSPQFKEFVFIGMLGAFTTFSTYSLETFNLFKNNEVKLALINILISNFSCILSAYIGYILSKQLLKMT